MATELAALEANNTWEFTPLPPYTKLVGCHWLFKVKYCADGTVERYKGWVSLRTLLAISAIKGWMLTQLDVYMTLPQRYNPPPFVLQRCPGQRLVCKLIKSLYRLKQAPRCWFVKLFSVLILFGFKQSASDHNMFVHTHQDSGLYYSYACLR